MSVRRVMEDGAVELEALERDRRGAAVTWPETTPTLGITPVLADEEARSLARSALEAVGKSPRRRPPAWEAEERVSRA